MYIMKKYAVLALAFTLVVGVTGVAFAAPQAISVSFFLDNAGTGFPPAGSAGQLAAYIRLKNETSSTIAISVDYSNPDGSTANTDR